MRQAIRGRIVKHRRAIRTQSGTELRMGAMPLLLVHVRNTRRWIRQFEHIARKSGLTVKLVDEQRAVWEVTGSPFVMEKLTQSQCVQDWGYPLNVRPCIGGMHRAGGTGPEKRVRATGSGAALTPGSKDGLGY